MRKRTLSGTAYLRPMAIPLVYAVDETKTMAEVTNDWERFARETIAANIDQLLDYIEVKVVVGDGES